MSGQLQMLLKLISFALHAFPMHGFLFLPHQKLLVHSEDCQSKKPGIRNVGEIIVLGKPVGSSHVGKKGRDPP